MIRAMRRFKQQLSEEETAAILKAGSSGVLAVTGDDDYPYAVPMSYVYSDGSIFFHSAMNGAKVDGIRRAPKASFCVVDKDTIVPEKFTTVFRSAIAFGTARIVEDEAEKRLALAKLARKYSPAPELDQARDKEVEGALARVCIIELKIEHLTGKEAIELTRER